MGLKQRNKSKTTYTALAAIMLDCVSWGTEGQGVPMRQHGLLHTGSQSKDLHVGFPQSDARAS